MSASLPVSGNPQIGSKRAWFIFSLCALTFGYAFFHRVAPSVMVADLMKEFAISATILGTLSSLYFYPYVIMQIFLGALIDRLGPRILLTGAILLGAAGSFLFASAEYVSFAYAGRLLIGIGSAVSFLATLAIAGKWFPKNRFAFLSGLVMFFGMMSGVFASGPLSLFVEAYGWRNAMWALGIFSLTLASMIFIFVKNEPESMLAEAAKPIESWSAMWRKLGQALSTLEVWKVAFVASAMSGPMLALGTLWATPYLVLAYDLQPANAAFLVSFMLLGWAFGAPFFGWLSDRMEKRKILLVANSAVLTVLLAALVFLDTPPLQVTVCIFILTGFTGSAMAITFALAREVNDPRLSGAVTGIVNSMTVASGAFLQPVVGIILDSLWDGKLADGSPVYSAVDYRLAFGSILTVVAIGFLITLGLKESPIAEPSLATAKS